MKIWNFPGSNYSSKLKYRLNRENTIVTLRRKILKYKSLCSQLPFTFAKLQQRTKATYQGKRADCGQSEGIKPCTIIVRKHSFPLNFPQKWLFKERVAPRYVLQVKLTQYTLFDNDVHVGRYIPLHI